MEWFYVFVYLQVNSLEDFLSKQTITLSEFSEREKDHLTLGDTTRERLFHLSGENKVFQDRVAELERRVNDCSEQNRDLIAIAGKKEEVCYTRGPYTVYSR